MTENKKKPKALVIYHSADYDGIFCREIARYWLKAFDVETSGWNFGDLPFGVEGMKCFDRIYVLDLPVDEPFGRNFRSKDPEEAFLPSDLVAKITWIDHHGSSIASHDRGLRGYRIDGVAACRLAWQWFLSANLRPDLPSKEDFLDRRVKEPYPVRLAGEYDVWDKRDPYAEFLQFGLRSQDLADSDWYSLLTCDEGVFDGLIVKGTICKAYQEHIDASLIKHGAYMIRFRGIRFLFLIHGRFNSNTFKSLDVPETGHDALLGCSFALTRWRFSLYHARHRKDLDLSKIAVSLGGGGHKGACGFTCRHWTMTFPEDRDPELEITP